jgi:hypothetical protein
MAELGREGWKLLRAAETAECVLSIDDVSGEDA